MVVKVKENFEKTRHVENNDKSEKYVLRGERKVRYHNRILSRKKSSNYVDISRQNIFHLLLKKKINPDDFSYYMKRIKPDNYTQTKKLICDWSH